MLFDPTHINFDEDAFFDRNWEEFHGDVKEQVPLNHPPEKGSPLQCHCSLMQIVPEMH